MGRVTVIRMLNYVRVWADHISGFIDLMVTRERKEEFKEIIEKQVKEELQDCKLDVARWMDVYHEATGNTIGGLGNVPEFAKKSVDDDQKPEEKSPGEEKQWEFPTLFDLQNIDQNKKHGN